MKRTRHRTIQHSNNPTKHRPIYFLLTSVRRAAVCFHPQVKLRTALCAICFSISLSTSISASALQWRNTKSVLGRNATSETFQHLVAIPGVALKSLFPTEDFYLRFASTMLLSSFPGKDLCFGIVNHRNSSHPLFLWPAPPYTPTEPSSPFSFWSTASSPTLSVFLSLPLILFHVGSWGGTICYVRFSFIAFPR